MQYVIQVICNVWEILNTSFLSSLLGSLFAAIIFWIIFQESIRKLIEDREIKRISGAFLEELFYNHIVVSKNILKKEYYLSSKELNTIEYETGVIAEFLAKEPLNLEKEFYVKLRIFYSAGLKKDNMLLKIHWFAPNLTPADIVTAKHNYLNNSTNVLKQIEEILSNPKFLSYMKKMGFTDKLKEIS